ncbi:hypothetical protein HPP92_008436 [Vanilla planifolia]|uniref:N-acetyltransferase domain-containing protein n=1 Tax=Vanilla planifolia TaxID=51239 RepID=A0A835V3S3_VANPL|nr:hypothetical protein HPP92_008436 [Vanilla planifolia]
MSSAKAPSPEQPAIWSRIRLGDRCDIPIMHRLIQQSIASHLLDDHFSPNECSLSALFPSSPLPPFRSYTVLILELSPSPIVSNESESDFRPLVKRIALQSVVEDPEAAAFASPRGAALVVAGFVLCFPNYSTFMGRPGLYVEDIFVREVWRRRGLGRMMLTLVVREAAKMGCGKVEWSVLDRNDNASSFYEGMGAAMFPQWRIFRLTGEELSKYAGEEEDRDGQL